MEIKKRIKNDKKEKHNSFELYIAVPVMSIPQSLSEIGGFVSCDEVEYICHYGSEEAANEAFEEFLENLSGHYNIHKNHFIVKDS